MVRCSSKLTRLESLRCLLQGGPFAPDLRLRWLALGLLLAVLMTTAGCFESPVAPTREKVQPVPTTPHT